MDKIINYYIYNLNYINKLVENTCIVLLIIILLYLIKIYRTNISEIKNKMLPVLIISFVIPIGINTIGTYLKSYSEKNINIEKNEINLLEKIEEITNIKSSIDNPNTDKLPPRINNFNKDNI